MKLFQLTNSRTHKPVPGLFFANKLAAKQARKERNLAEYDTTYFVSPGPDHHRYAR